MSGVTNLQQIAVQYPVLIVGAGHLSSLRQPFSRWSTSVDGLISVAGHRKCPEQRPQVKTAAPVSGPEGSSNSMVTCGFAEETTSNVQCLSLLSVLGYLGMSG